MSLIELNDEICNEISIKFRVDVNEAKTEHKF